MKPSRCHYCAHARIAFLFVQARAQAGGDPRHALAIPPARLRPLMLRRRHRLQDALEWREIHPSRNIGRFLLGVVEVNKLNDLRLGNASVENVDGFNPTPSSGCHPAARLERELFKRSCLYGTVRARMRYILRGSGAKIATTSDPRNLRFTSIVLTVTINVR
jgi:hypothetical protein